MRIGSLLLAAVLLASAASAGEFVQVPVGGHSAVAVPLRFQQRDLERRGEMLAQFNIIAVYDQEFPDSRLGKVSGKVLVMRDHRSTTLAFYYPEGGRRRSHNYVLQGSPVVLPLTATLAMDVHPQYRVPCVTVQFPGVAEQRRIFLIDGVVNQDQVIITQAPRVVERHEYWHREPAPPPPPHRRGPAFDWRGLVTGVLDATARSFR
ncbi:MAG: hypothetical protein J6333_01975 [Planctomycetes bacterium]|nr:hypothetical protein [Planctomycetota bacterium]